MAGSGKADSENGIGTAASFNDPTGITIDGSGNLYVADANNDLIRKISPGALVTTVAGLVPKAALRNTLPKLYFHSGKLFANKPARLKKFN